MSRPVGIALLVLGGYFAATASADERNYATYLPDVLLDISVDMAACAGRQEAVAEEFLRAENPASAEISRRSGKSFEQCAWYLRTMYIKKESVQFYREQVAKEAEIGKLYLQSAMELDDLGKMANLVSECRALDKEVRACAEDQERFLEAARAKRDQNETTRSQPEPP